MTDRFLRMKDVVERTSLNRATIYRKITAGEFPKSVKLGPAIVAWRESDIAAWMKDPTGWNAAAQDAA